MMLASPLAGAAHLKPRDTPTVSFRFSVAGKPVQDGKLWLFYFGWGFREIHKLGGIRNGLIAITIDSKEWFETVEPDAFALVVEVPGAGWYRTADLHDASEAVSAVEQLGRSQVQNGTHRIDLPRPTRQTFRTLNSDGTPRGNATLRIEMWATAANHCGVHEGFGDWRTLTTDRNGVAAFSAPLHPLYVEAAFYEEHLIRGRRVLSLQHGRRMEPTIDHVLKGVWDPPRDGTFRIHVEGVDGKPAIATLLRDNDACMSPGTPVGSTDAHGDIVATFAPKLVRTLRLAQDDRVWESGDDLTDDEFDQLLATGRISIVWPRRR
jgi:hypothetical protein